MSAPMVAETTNGTLKIGSEDCFTRGFLIET
jgi:hypothetical protein